MIRPLRLRVTPHCDESLLSILSRAACRNHLESVHPLVAAVGVSSRSATVIRSNPELAAPLATLLGLPEVDVRAGQYDSVGKDEGTTFRGTLLPRRHWAARRRRVAPEALRREAYHRAIWDLAVFGSCPETGDHLIDRCPSCGRWLSWLYADVTLCHGCGYDLRRAALDAVPEEYLRGTRRLADLLEPGRGATERSRQLLSPEFLGASLGSILDVAFIMAPVIASLHGTLEPRVGRSDLWARGKCPHIQGELWALLTGWSDRLPALLDACRSSAASQGGVTAGEAIFGPAFWGAWRTCDGRVPSWPPGNLLREALRGYLDEHRDIAVDAKFARRLGLADKRILDAKTLAREHGIGHRRLEHLIRAFPEVVNRRSVVAGGKRAKVFMHREQISALMAEVSGLVGPRWLLREQGISYLLCRSLVEAGLLEPAAHDLARLATKHGSKDIAWLFRRDAVEALLARFCAGLPRGRSDGEFCDFRTALSCVGRRRVSSVAFLQVLSSSVLRPRALDPNRRGFAALLFGRAELTAFCTRELAPKFGGALTFVQTMNSLGWSPTALRTVLSQGLANFRRVGAGKGIAVLLDPSEVERLRAEYTSAGNLAKRYNLSVPAVSRLINGAGVRSVTLGLSPGGGNNGGVYRVCDLSKAGVIAILGARAATTIGDYPFPEGDVSEAEWAVLGPLLRPGFRHGKAYAEARLMFDAIGHVLRTRRSWSALPTRYGSGGRAYQRLRVLAAAGVWEGALSVVRQDGGSPNLEQRLTAIVSYCRRFTHSVQG